MNKRACTHTHIYTYTHVQSHVCLHMCLFIQVQAILLPIRYREIGDHAWVHRLSYPKRRDLTLSRLYVLSSPF